MKRLLGILVLVFLLCPSLPGQANPFCMPLDGAQVGFTPDGFFVAQPLRRLAVDFIGHRRMEPTWSVEGMKRQTAEFRGVEYPNLWPGVSLGFYNRRDSRLWLRLRIEHSKQLSRVRFRFNRSLSVDYKGRLLVEYELMPWRLASPRAFVESPGGHVPLEVSYRLLGVNELGLRVQGNPPEGTVILEMNVGVKESEEGI